jgi:hypothetical protein
MLIEWIVKEKEVKYLIIIPREVDSEDDQKTDGGIVYKQILIDAKLQTGKRGQKQLTGLSPLRRQRSALDCSAISKKKKKNK